MKYPIKRMFKYLHNSLLMTEHERKFVEISIYNTKNRNIEVSLERVATILCCYLKMLLNLILAYLNKYLNLECTKLK